ncbi:ArdC-like ssDNA-binding domain-containing protein [Gloeothece verrucosa]|nr:ArdC family protein [Gloeothece verrucosa]
MVTATATDKNQLITDKLITLIEKGVTPWSQPWYSSPFQNFLTKHIYRGINPILCQIDLVINNWEYPFFITFQQAKELNWLIKKGSKAT